MERVRIARVRGRQARVALALRSELLLSLGFRHGFSLRAGGVSEPPFATLNLGRSVGDDAAAVAENHRRFAREVGYDPERLYEVSQVHGGAVELVDEAVAPSAFRERPADALLALAGECAVGVRTADCVPILLADEGSGAVAAVHAGWRGVVANVIEHAVSALERAGRSRDRLAAAVFPCIGAAAFEVGEEVAEAIASAVGDKSVVHERAPRPHVDLARAVELALGRAGIAAARIDVIEGCTYGDAARFYSFRRDGARSGRHLAAIAPRC